MLLAGAALLWALPTATAADTATATPATAEPGDTISLVYTLDATALANVDVLQDVRCVLVAPDGETDCGAITSLADARVQGGARSFAFQLVAPSAAGSYEARFTRSAAVSVSAPPGPPAGASATFEVVLPAVEDPSDLLENAGAPPVQLPTMQGGGAWLASVFMASGAIAACVAVVRQGGR